MFLFCILKQEEFHKKFKLFNSKQDHRKFLVNSWSGSFKVLIKLLISTKRCKIILFDA